MRNFKEEESLNTLNHSCAHLLAQAVSHLYPNAKFWVGPVIEEGFYYDIDLGDVSLNEEDLLKKNRLLTLGHFSQGVFASPIRFGDIKININITIGICRDNNLCMINIQALQHFPV